VNVASRVEGATKQLGVSTLLTGATRAGLGESFALRRLCDARVVGMEDPVSLYELCDESSGTADAARRVAYEAALELYEQGRWSEACHALFPLLPAERDAPDSQYDQPTLSLLARTLECLRTHPSPFVPIVELATK
jgi:adenylate cyclase